MHLKELDVSSRTLIVCLISFLLLLHVEIVRGSQENVTNGLCKSSSLWFQENVTNGSFKSSSLWLKRVVKNPRAIGCRNRPWICNEGEFPPRIKKRCCRNRCIDVTSDVNNCGFCGIRCPFTWQCCRGICFNTNMDPFHCGRCDHRCQLPSLCYNGMCGYAQPLPPWPFPPRPPYPFPPKPPQPPYPFPPKPPRPPHPHFPWPPYPFPPRTSRPPWP